MREKLGHLVERLAQLKITMQKTPITIDEDQVKLERESEKEITSIIHEIESFFQPMSANLDAIINPIIKQMDEEEQQ